MADYAALIRPTAWRAASHIAATTSSFDGVGGVARRLLEQKHHPAGVLADHGKVLSQRFRGRAAIEIEPARCLVIEQFAARTNVPIVAH